MALASLALLLVAPHPVPAPQDVLEVLVKSGDVLPVGADAFTVLSVPRPTAGIGGGWVTPAFGSFASSAPDTGIALIGRRPGQGTSGAEVLRAPQTLAGRTQRDLRVGAMINGQIAYLAFTQSNPFEAFPDTVWLEDELIAAAGDTIPGGTDTWSRFIAVKATTNDTLIIHGTVGAPGTKGILVEWPTGRVLHEDGVQYPGLPDSFTCLSSFDVSPSGDHWAGIVMLTDGSPDRPVVVLDGAPYRFPTGEYAFHRNDLPASLAPGADTFWWRSFSRVMVNDRGDFAFSGSNAGFDALIRNGRLQGSLSSGYVPTGMDERGIILSQIDQQRGIFVENERVTTGQAELDLDGDGLPEPGWRSADSTSTRELMGPAQQSLTVFRELIRSPSNSLESAILRARNYRVDRPFCEGIVNSTGTLGHMVASGDLDIATNDVVFQAYNLPSGAPGYFMVSKTPGMSPQNGTVNGVLCLSGSIGRMRDQVFFASEGGQARAVLDLANIPQPMGSAAAMAGETWFAQAWHRDSSASGPTSILTGAVAVTFVD